jgi:hypothetical protein
MSAHRYGRRFWLAAPAVALAACTTSVKVGPRAVAGRTPSGAVDMNEVQVAYVGNADGGSGTLYFRASPTPSRWRG